MNTPRQLQHPLRTPLNTILGSEASVRLLRVLARSDIAFAAGELARRAGLGRTAIYPVLGSLERAGIITFVGAGAQRHIGFRAEHPLSRAIKGLFVAEATRVEGLVAGLRDTLNTNQPKPTSAWLESIPARDQGSDGLMLYVTADPRMLASITDGLTGAVGKIEQKFGVHIDVRALSRSEVEARARSHLEQLQEAILLYGVAPVALAHVSQPTSALGTSGQHDAHDERARRLGVAIATKLKRDPSLVRAMREDLVKRRTQASRQEQRELQEWERLLDAMSPAQLRRVLVERSERATRLRQSLPALALLTPRERSAVLASTTDAEAKAAVSGK